MAAAREQLAPVENLKSLEKRLRTLQRELGRRQRLPPGPGRYWQSPTRQADSGKPGTLTLDRLALLLQQRGLRFRQAQKVVQTILDCMIQRLRGGEQVDVPPLGTFFIKEQPPQQQRTRFGRTQTLFRQRTKIAFRPSRALRMILAHKYFPEKQPEPPPKKGGRYCCEKCGSTMLVQSEFQRYTQMPSSLPGGGLRSDIMEGRLPMRALICLCGHPKRLERMRRPLPGDQASFEKSFEMAVRWRENADAQIIIDKLPGHFAGRKEQIALEERISRTEKIVRALPGFRQ